MGKGKNWTLEEKQYLSDNWGMLSIGTLMKRLNRSKNAINIMVNRMGLGAFLENGDYVTWNQFQIAIGNGKSSSGYKMKSWVENRGFPIHTKRVGKNTFKIVYIDEFWKWAEKNKDLLDFSKLEEKVLGAEPEWVKEKRKRDFEKSRKFIMTPWTPVEDARLVYLLQQQRYTYEEISRMVRRTNGAVQRRICDLGIKDRPVKADNHMKWTEKDFEILCELIKDGYGYELISGKIRRSAKAVRGRVYAMYLTENLDKVREMIGSGSWGDNRPERKIKHWNVMNTQERIETRDLIIRLAAVLQHEFKERSDG